MVDAANVLSRASADVRRGGRLPGGGDGIAAAWADWLRFLEAIAKPQLLVAVFDAPRANRRQPQQREQLAGEYLRRRRRRTTNAVGVPAGDPLRPFKQQVQQLGGVCLEADGGWEADDGIAAACRAARECRPASTVVIASGDTDMQQLLGPQVSWLRLHNQPTLACPLAAELLTAADFARLHGFPPSAYADWLALVGKKEASIAGASVGAKTAAKLLARYGGLERVLAAAAAGELRGWGPAAQRLLCGGAPGAGQAGGGGDRGLGGQREALLRRNRRVFALNDDPAVVAPHGMAQLLAALHALQTVPADSHVAALALSDASGSAQTHPQACVPGASNDRLDSHLAWLQPMHARRRRHLESQSAAHTGAGAPGLAVTAQGLPVDAVWEPAGASHDPAAAGEERRAAFYVCPCDVPPDSWPRAVDAAGRQPPAAELTALLLPLLHGAMRRHVRLVQRAGYRVELALAQAPRRAC